MSIYGRRKGVMDYDRVEGAHLPQRDAHVDAGESASGLSPDDDFAALRKATPADQLLSFTLDWCRNLPVEVAPRALITQFPRIANLVARQWRDRHGCPAYFDELLVDRRGGRRGFPPAVRQELQTLRDFWYVASR